MITVNDVLDKLDLKLGMQVIDKQRNKDKILKKKPNDEIFTLVKDDRSVVVFENEYGWRFQPLYVLTHIGTRFKWLI